MPQAIDRTTTPSPRRARGAAPAIAAGLVEAPGPLQGMRAIPAYAMTIAPGVRLPRTASVYFDPSRKPPADLDADLCVGMTPAGELRLTVLSSQPDGGYLEHLDGIGEPRPAPRYEAVWPVSWTRMR